MGKFQVLSYSDVILKQQQGHGAGSGLYRQSGYLKADVLYTEMSSSFRRLFPQFIAFPVC